MKSFDPYHVWLGIPHELQPANHYRLLGIPLFEGNADVIATAADRQMGHLRTFQSGKQSDLSQRLLNEVAAAKVCLLNPAKKKAYDSQLRGQLQTQSVSPQIASSGPDDSLPWAELAGNFVTSTRLNSRTQPRNAARQRRQNLARIVALVVAIMVAAGSLLLGRWATRNAPSNADHTKRVTVSEKPAEGPLAGLARNRPKPDVRHAAEEDSIPPDPMKSAVVGRSSEPEAASVGKPRDEPFLAESAGPPVAFTDGSSIAKPVDHAAENTKAADTARPVFKRPVETNEKQAIPTFDTAIDKTANQRFSPPKSNRRLPVPDGEEQRKVVEQIGEIYSLDRVKTPSGQIKLARQLLRAASASLNNTERFGLLRQGCQLAVQGGDVALALQAVEMTSDFDIDVHKEKAGTLIAAAEKATNTEHIRAVCGSSQGVIAQLLREDRCPLALDVANVVCRACQPSPGEKYRKKAIVQRDWVRKYCVRQERRHEIEAKLRVDSSDDSAHLALGRDLCCDDNWQEGLPHLAKGSDVELRQLASRDLASPAQAEQQVKLADGWWTLSRGKQGEERDAYLLRAGHWYECARAGIDSGLERLKIEKRLEEIVQARQRHDAHSLRRLLGLDKSETQDLWRGLL